MDQIKVALLSFSDGRNSVHQDLLPYIQQQSEIIRTTLEETGQVEVIEASQVIWSNHLAQQCAIEIKAALPDAIIFNVPIFSFPNFSLVAESILRLPVLVISNVNGSLPGLGGLQAVSNLLNQCGYPCEKVWGNITCQDIIETCMHFLRAAHASNKLRGQVFGLIGGRSIGIGSGSGQSDRWQQVFGVDIDHTDQSEILRRAPLVSKEEVDRACNWLQTHLSISWDGDKLTPESLQEQVRHYCATRDICREKGYSFVGVKCHDELSSHSCAQCLSAAFFNDPYDWNGPKEPFVFTCEGDCEGGLTMQIMKLLTGYPALFMDLRYYDQAENILYLCNCGAMATWYTCQSGQPEENLAKATMTPLIPKYRGKGAHIMYIAQESPMTFGRITHDQNGFLFTVFTGQARKLPPEKAQLTCPNWPHMFVVPDVDFQTLLREFPCNHVHGICGNHVEEIRQFCVLSGIRFHHIK